MSVQAVNTDLSCFLSHLPGESSIEKTILYSRPRSLIVFMILPNLCSSPNHIFALSSEQENYNYVNI